MKFTKIGKRDKIDSVLDDAQLRGLSAENLNRLGDMCLKKEDKRTAIRYFYSSIDKLHPSQEGLIIALYKKIIRISSSEERAYLALIDIFSTMNLAADEAKYLGLLALYYQNVGQHKKLNDIYKRVLKIDPRNSIALNYYKDKQGLPAASTSQQSEDSAEREKAGIVDEGGDGDEDKEPYSAVKISDGSPPGHKNEEAAGKTVFSEEKRGWRKKVYLFVSIAVILSVFVVIFRHKGEFKGVDEKTGNQQARGIGRGSFWNKKLMAKDYELTIEAVPAEFFDKSGLSGAIKRSDLLNNLFYSVTIRAISRCLPDQLASSPRDMIFFIGAKGEPEKSEEVKGLQNMDRVIYKASVQGCVTNSPVFIKVFLCQKRGVETGGLSIKGLDKKRPVIMLW